MARSSSVGASLSRFAPDAEGRAAWIATALGVHAAGGQARSARRRAGQGRTAMALATVRAILV